MQDNVDEYLPAPVGPPIAYYAHNMLPPTATEVDARATIAHESAEEELRNKEESKSRALLKDVFEHVYVIDEYNKQQNRKRRLLFFPGNPHTDEVKQHRKVAHRHINRILGLRDDDMTTASYAEFNVAGTGKRASPLYALAITDNEQIDWLDQVLADKDIYLPLRVSNSTSRDNPTLLNAMHIYAAVKIKEKADFFERELGDYFADTTGNRSADNGEFPKPKRFQARITKAKKPTLQERPHKLTSEPDPHAWRNKASVQSSDWNQIFFEINEGAVRPFSKGESKTPALQNFKNSAFIARIAGFQMPDGFLESKPANERNTPLFILAAKRSNGINNIKELLQFPLGLSDEDLPRLPFIKRPHNGPLSNYYLVPLTHSEAVAVSRSLQIPFLENKEISQEECMKQLKNPQPAQQRYWEHSSKSAYPSR